MYRLKQDKEDHTTSPQYRFSHQIYIHINHEIRNTLNHTSLQTNKQKHWTKYTNHTKNIMNISDEKRCNTILYVVFFWTILKMANHAEHVFYLSFVIT